MRDSGKFTTAPPPTGSGAGYCSDGYSLAPVPGAVESRRHSLCPACYYPHMFNFGQPKTVGDWIVHIAGAVIALFLVWWMLRVYVL